MLQTSLNITAIYEPELSIGFVNYILFGFKARLRYLSKLF